MLARVTTFMGGAEHIDEGLAMFRDTALPEIEHQPGFDGALFLTDPEDRIVYAITFWETEADLRASAGLSKRLADTAGRQFGSKTETDSCEVALSTIPALVG